MPPRPPHERHVPSSAISGFIDASRISALIEPWVPDAQSREFVVRCLLGEGPAHHRGANYVLLRLLGQVLERLPAHAATKPSEGLQVPMRLPPHLAQTLEQAQAYPLPLPKAPLELLAPEGSRDFDAMVDCLTDGPPQHALANVAMVTLISEILLRLEEEGR